MQSIDFVFFTDNKQDHFTQCFEYTIQRMREHRRQSP